MTNPFQDQRTFMEACGQTTDDENRDQYKLYLDLIEEEVQELRDSTTPEGDLDALIDIMGVTAGALHSMGVDAPGAWKEVMRSNFAKVDQRTGKVIRREDGKILKPANWEPPRLKGFMLPS